MSGHNKWSKIKHTKGRTDALKARVFSKCANEITLAARSGGGNPDANSRLRTAIENAKAISLPKENIERAIKKGTGELGGAAVQHIVYECYGPGAIPFIVEVATDNLNRAASDMRTILTKYSGNIGSQGSVMYQFNRKGEIKLHAESVSEETIFEAAINCGADEVFSDEDEHTVLTSPSLLSEVANFLHSNGYKIISEKFSLIPQNYELINDINLAQQLLKLQDQLEDYQDTLNVYSNYELSDEVIANL